MTNDFQGLSQPAVVSDTVNMTTESVAYAKGAVSNRMIMDAMSSSGWDTALTQYIAAHEFGTAVLDDLLNSFEAVLPGTKSMGHAWLTQPTFPVVNVSLSGATVTLHQTPIARTTSKDVLSSLLWSIPVVLELTDEQGNVDHVQVVLNTSASTFTLPKAPKSLRANTNFTAFAAVRYQSVEQWQHHLQGIFDPLALDSFRKTGLRQVLILARNGFERVQRVTQAVEALNVYLLSSAQALSKADYYSTELLTQISALYFVLARGDAPKSVLEELASITSDLSVCETIGCVPEKLPQATTAAAKLVQLFLLMGSGQDLVPELLKLYLTTSPIKEELQIPVFMAVALDGDTGFLRRLLLDHQNKSLPQSLRDNIAAGLVATSSSEALPGVWAMYQTYAWNAELNYVVQWYAVTGSTQVLHYLVESAQQAWKTQGLSATDTIIAATQTVLDPSTVQLLLAAAQNSGVALSPSQSAALTRLAALNGAALSINS